MSPLPILIVAILCNASRRDVARAEGSDEAAWKGFSVSCAMDGRTEVANGSMSCHGIRLVRRIVQTLLEEARRRRSLVIWDGISLVEHGDRRTDYKSGRVSHQFGQLGSLVRFLQSRELRISLPNFLPANLESAIQSSLPSDNEAQARRKKRRGNSSVMMLALMMGKMMAAMGFGALSLLTMKALMVSSLALMLSLIIAVKKLAAGKEEDSHTVVYAQEAGQHHQRKRRSGQASGDERDFSREPYRGYVMAMAVPTEAR